jgi:hypothetical protein
MRDSIFSTCSFITFTYKDHSLLYLYGLQYTMSQWDQNTDTPTFILLQNCVKLHFLGFLLSQIHQHAAIMLHNSYKCMWTGRTKYRMSLNASFTRWNVMAIEMCLTTSRYYRTQSKVWIKCNIHDTRNRRLTRLQDDSLIKKLKMYEN